MSDDPIASLLDAERARAGFSRDERASLWDSIASATTMPEAGTDPGGEPPPDPTPPAAAPPPAAPEVAAKATASAAALGGPKLAALLLAVAGVSAGVGAAAHAWLTSPPSPVATATTPSIPSSSSIPSSPPVASAVASAHVATPGTGSPTRIGSVVALPTSLPSAAAPRTAAPVSSSSGAATPASARAPGPSDPALARERTLLEMGRTALTRNDAPAALEALGAHAREFPSSQLAEEREVMTIQALVAAHRMPEARNRAATFRATFPKSPLVPIVDEATR